MNATDMVPHLAINAAGVTHHLFKQEPSPQAAHDAWVIETGGPEAWARFLFMNAVFIAVYVSRFTELAIAEGYTKP